MGLDTVQGDIAGRVRDTVRVIQARREGMASFKEKRPAAFRGCRVRHQEARRWNWGSEASAYS
jgi:hypothetical protein